MRWGGRCFVAILVVAGTAAAARGDVLTDLGQCSILSTAEETQACYDRAIYGHSTAGANPAQPDQTQSNPPAPAPEKKPAPTAEPIDPNDVGVWHIHFDRSQIDDSESVFLSVPSMDILTTRYGDETRPVLILRCLENETDVIINWDRFSFYSDGAEVTARIDKKKAGTRTWNTSTDNEALFHPQPIAFIKSMLNAETLLVRVTPISDDPREVSFYIHGLRNVLPPLKKACHWN